MQLPDIIDATQAALAGPIPESLAQKYLKTVQKRVSQGDHSIGSVLAKVLNEVFRGQALVAKMAQPLAKLRDMKQRAAFISGTANLYRAQATELKEEVEDALVKEKNMRQEMRDTLKKTDLKELQHLRNE